MAIWALIYESLVEIRLWLHNVVAGLAKTSKLAR